MKAKCEYILASAFYGNRKHGDAFYHLQNFENLKINLSENEEEMLKLELLLIEWNCDASDDTIEAMQNIIAKSMSIKYVPVF